MNLSMLRNAAKVKTLEDVDATLLDGTILKLIGDAFTLNQNLDPTTLVESAFGGYVAKTIAAFGDAFIGSDGVARKDAPSQQFNHDGAGATGLVYGYWLETSVANGSLVYQVAKLDPPVPMVDANSSLVVQPRVSLQQDPVPVVDY